jgi:hypothetical protein
MTNIPSEYRIPGDEAPWRTQAILAFEAEFDTFVSPTHELKWGMRDMFFLHEGHAYYYKPKLQNELDIDKKCISEEGDAKRPLLEKIVNYLGYEIEAFSIIVPDITLNWMKENVFAKEPSGFPKFELETPNFFVFKIECENPNNIKHITIDDLDRPTLDKIKKSIGGDYNPFLTPYFDSSLYDFDGRYYCMDPFAYYYNPNPNGQIGIFLHPDYESLKYEDAKINSYFFTFQRITPEQREFISILGKIHTFPPQHLNPTIIKEYFKL